VVRREAKVSLLPCVRDISNDRSGRTARARSADRLRVDFGECGQRRSGGAGAHNGLNTILGQWAKRVSATNFAE
jgi:hypothetical protein